ncbi:hypothetical protein Tco_1052812, partial [Tanacetum coccineum]
MGDSDIQAAVKKGKHHGFALISSVIILSKMLQLLKGYQAATNRYNISTE